MSSHRSSTTANTAQPDETDMPLTTAAELSDEQLQAVAGGPTFMLD
jgi:hypothetical protein